MPVYERQWLSRKPVPPGRRLAPILGGNQAVQPPPPAGLALVPSAENKTGFKHVRGNYGAGSASKPFIAAPRQDGRTKFLGRFATVESAALAVARFLGPEGVAMALALAARMTPAEAHAAAEQEGLTLLRAENMTGFTGVCRSGNVSSNQFQAQLKHDGRQKHLGNFANAESAALAIARFLRSEGITAAQESFSY